MDGGTVTRCNFAGDQMAGASWTDKIMANKADAATSQATEGEGAGEEEWVRALLSFVLSGMFVWLFVFEGWQKIDTFSWKRCRLYWLGSGATCCVWECLATVRLVKQHWNPSTSWVDSGSCCCGSNLSCRISQSHELALTCQRLGGKWRYLIWLNSAPAVAASVLQIRIIPLFLCQDD